MEANREKRIRLLFVLSILLKAFNGVIEVVLGVALLFTSTLAELTQTFIQNELIDDPTDFVANFTQHYIYPFLTHPQSFASAYLLSHGIVKLFIAVGLLQKKLWAYPTAIIVFALFIIYQMHRYLYTHSPFLIMLTIFDLFVIYLTWHEYKILKDTPSMTKAT